MSPLAALAAVAAAGILTASSDAGPPKASTANIRPICVDRGFNLPGRIGEKVTIPVHEYGADPDVTPVQLVDVDVIHYGPELGTAEISGNDIVFTRTTSNRGTVYVYWTISDGSLTSIPCFVYASNEEPPEGG
jgi:hypothetical protein